jgi:hypothetical protein
MKERDWLEDLPELPHDDPFYTSGVIMIRFFSNRERGVIENFLKSDDGSNDSLSDYVNEEEELSLRSLELSHWDDDGGRINTTNEL